MGAFRNSFIPNSTVVVQIVQIYTVGIRRKCAFFRQAALLRFAGAKVQTFSYPTKKKFQAADFQYIKIGAAPSARPPMTYRPLGLHQFHALLDALDLTIEGGIGLVETVLAAEAALYAEVELNLRLGAAGTDGNLVALVGEEL